MRTYHIKFCERKKIFFGISLAIIAIGIIFNFIFGTSLDIQFTGGAVIRPAGRSGKHCEGCQWKRRYGSYP